MPVPKHLEFRTSRNTRYHLLAHLPDSEKPAWFFFHGFLGQAEDWFPVIHHLPEDTPWYAVDMLGHGQSEQPHHPGSYLPESLYRDVAEILNHFHHSDQDLAVGYSMGGRQLLGACIQEQGRSLGALILMGAHFGLKTDTKRAARQQMDQRWAAQLRHSLQSFLTAWYQQPLLSRQPPTDPQQYAQWSQRRLDNDPETLALCLTEFSPARTPDFSTTPLSLQLPVLLMSGEYDTRYVAHYKEIVESLPQACHIIVPDCGHTLPIEAPKATFESCLKFLNSLPR